MEITEAFRRQAEACGGLGSPMYAGLLDRVAEDLAQGGVTASVLAGHQHDPGPSALALRLLGSVHRLVLERRAPRLALYYPSVGGTWDLGRAWPEFSTLLAEHPAAVAEWLDRPPQTNEVGRATGLMGGLLQLRNRLPVRLFEIGSSAGLILLADRFRYADEAGRVFGDPGSDVHLDGAWEGHPLTPWPALRVVERLGSDLVPVDPGTTEGRLTLTAYVWPDQAARLERLRGALALAARVPVEVRRSGAASFVGGLELQEATTTVLWHSVMWQYLDREERSAVERGVARLADEATPTRPFVHLCLEPLRRTPESEHEFLVVMTEWPGGDRRVIGTSQGHGVPTRWDEKPSTG